MKASEFIEKLKELMHEYNESNDVIINDITVNPTTILHETGAYVNIGYKIKFQVQ